MPTFLILLMLVAIVMFPPLALVAAVALGLFLTKATS